MRTPIENRVWMRYIVAPRRVTHREEAFEAEGSDATGVRHSSLEFQLVDLLDFDDSSKRLLSISLREHMRRQVCTMQDEFSFQSAA